MKRHRNIPKSTQYLKNILLMLAIFGFVFFGVLLYLQWSQGNRKPRTATPKSTEHLVKQEILNETLTQYNLVDSEGNQIPDTKILNGNVVLSFVNETCEFCKGDAEFLKTKIPTNVHVKFIGILAFSTSANLKKANNMFPFPVFYSKNGTLFEKIGLKGVPVKLFIKNGRIIGAMEGSTTHQNKEPEFEAWLSALH
ncbi:MAG: peroxiredoxin family protein [Pyrinomonadaceae bacterium]